MTTHYMSDDLLPVCGGGGEDGHTVVSPVKEDVTCFECSHFDEVQEEWEKYVSQPVNFGAKPDPIAERDAFFTAAFTFIKKNYPF